MKKFLAAAVLGLAACAFSASDAQAGCYYYHCPSCGQPHIRYAQPRRSFLGRAVGGLYWGTRDVMGDVAAVVTTVHPVIRVADCMGIVDRRQIVRHIRGY